MSFSAVAGVAARFSRLTTMFLLMAGVSSGAALAFPAPGPVAGAATVQRPLASGLVKVWEHDHYWHRRGFGYDPWFDGYWHGGWYDRPYYPYAYPPMGSTIILTEPPPVIVQAPPPVYVQPPPVMVQQPPVVVPPSPQIAQSVPPYSPSATQPPPAPLAVQAQPGSWYYCDNPKGYYPYVHTCTTPFRAVPAH